jgi:hypothetical protein
VVVEMAVRRMGTEGAELEEDGRWRPTGRAGQREHNHEEEDDVAVAR